MHILLVCTEVWEQISLGGLPLPLKADCGVFVRYLPAAQRRIGRACFGRVFCWDFPVGVEFNRKPARADAAAELHPSLQLLSLVMRLQASLKAFGLKTVQTVW